MNFRSITAWRCALAALSLSIPTGAVGQGLDERIEAPLAPPPPPPGVQTPVGPDSEFATDGTGPTDMVQPPPVATPIVPGAPEDKTALPMGATVAPQTTGIRLVEEIAPERIQVYPDDPESAWWEINPSYAFDRAQREQRPLLLLFTGAWNSQAMSLSEEVFSTKSFNNYVKENLVICYLNYPRNFNDASPAMQNIKEKFKVRGYPNVLIFNPNGDVERGITGYRSGRPIDYFNKLQGACKPVLESIKAQKRDLVKYGFRDWSNYLGKEIFARFVKRDETRVVIQDVGLVMWKFSINDLAPEDQKLVESFPPVANVDDEEPE